MKAILPFVAAFAMGIAPCLAQAPAAPTFSLSPADVGKVVIFMYVGGKTWIEVTYGKEKEAEFAKLAADNLNKPISIMLDGKVVAERTLTSATVGHSIKIDMPTPDEAFATAKALLKR